MTNVNIFTVPFCGKTIPCPRRIWMKLIIGGLGGPVDGHGMINLCPQDEQVWRGRVLLENWKRVRPGRFSILIES